MTVCQVTNFAAFKIYTIAALGLGLAISTSLFSSASGADLVVSIPIQLTDAQNYDASPSPDGKKLVFISLISGKEQLFTMNSRGSNISQLTHDDADHEDPAWSPDGKKIAFVLITGDHNSIAVMDSDGSDAEILTPKEQNTTTETGRPTVNR